MTQNEPEILLEAVLEIGRRMVQCGAEVRRAESAIDRMCAAYGCQRREVFATTTQILASIKDREGRHYRQSVRIFFTGNDLGGLESLDGLTDRLCADIPPAAEIGQYLDKIPAAKRRLAPELAGYMLAAGGFAVFFGGTLLDGAAASIIGASAVAMDRILRLGTMHRIMYAFIACFAAGALSHFFVRLGFAVHADKVMIGAVMLFIPALAIVNGVQEMFHRDIMTGLFRLIEALLSAFAIAAGFALSIMLFGRGLP